MSSLNNRRASLWLYFLLFDSLAIALSWDATLRLRVLLNPLFSHDLSYDRLLQITPPLSTLLMLWVLVTYWLRHSRPKPTLSSGAHISGVAESAALAGMLAVALIFFSREFGADLSRSFIVLFLPISLLGLVTTRYVALVTMFFIHRTWPVSERIAVIGSGPAVGNTIRGMRDDSGTVAMTGIILPVDVHESGGPWQVLGSTRQLPEIINSVHLSRVVLAENTLCPDELHRCASVCKRMGVVFNSVLSIGASDDVSIAITRQFGLQLLELTPRQFYNHAEWMKRCIDLTVALSLLVLLSPLLALIALLIKLTSPGPVLYCSKRVGKGGRHFEFYKFRTMYTGMKARLGLEVANEKDGHIFKLRNDPRVTTIGRWLRRWSLDELAQLVNVVKGDMSLVGPRPLPASDLDPDGQSRRFRKWAELRSSVLPGITGLWQIRGRSDLPFERMVELDLEYTFNRSLVLDLRIILETPIFVITGRGAY